jgi:isoleucyl-tRNA synthetase
VLSELSVKSLTFADDPEDRWNEGLMPLLPKLGPKYGKQIADIRKAIASGDVAILEDGRARVGEFTLDRDEYEHRSAPAEGFAVAEDQEWVVAIATTLDESLLREGLAREVVRTVQQLRKDSGLDITDRIAVQWQAGGELAAAIDEHRDSIAEEVLALSFAPGDPGAEATEATIDGESLRVELARA